MVSQQLTYNDPSMEDVDKAERVTQRAIWDAANRVEKDADGKDKERDIRFLGYAHIVINGAKNYLDPADYVELLTDMFELAQLDKEDRDKLFDYKEIDKVRKDFADQGLDYCCAPGANLK